MPSERKVEKLNDLLQEELSQILEREVEFPENTFVTITRVAVSPDRQYATIFISVYGGAEQSILEILAKNIYNIQQRINRTLRQRPIPKINFEIDREEIRREIVEKSLAELKRKKEL
ncbi:MAG: 30S ribosome-binding factor RbfA [Candidatus Sungiibacteriota bacterium]|uniref:Ribosome-binding factor A n=1 Tax=Candidatus Sungiibacteriota bacterium TaxID=2750080 RepID=A0A7T5UQW9_9BACT|nr:MAG: 30S ribosome-binding factor RbfA [Candidatus Sungbacteria bacterium]